MGCTNNIKLSLVENTIFFNKYKGNMHSKHNVGKKGSKYIPADFLWLLIFWHWKEYVKKIRNFIFAVWNAWGPFSACDTKCGIGKKTRDRTCSVSGCGARGHSQQTQERVCVGTQCGRVWGGGINCTILYVGHQTTGFFGECRSIIKVFTGLHINKADNCHKPTQLNKKLGRPF